MKNKELRSWEIIMKNKLLYILIVFLVGFSFMTNVFAEDEFEYTIDAVVDSTEVVVDSEIAVNIMLKSDATIDSCLFNVELDDNIEFVSLDRLNGWIVRNESIGENGILVESSSFTSAGQLSNGLNIVSLKYKVKGNGSLKITSKSYCSNGNSDVYAEEKVINFTTRELSEDNTLKSIKINGEMISEFSPDGNNYAVVLEKPNFSLAFETTNPDYQDDVVVKFNGDVVNDLNNMIWNDPLFVQKALSKSFSISTKTADSTLCSSLRVKPFLIISSRLFFSKYEEIR
jgi:hypothetical protein